MKIVYNNTWGGFRIPSALKSHHKNKYYGTNEIERNCEKLIAFIEERGGVWESRNKCARLVIAEIPDEATDWIITEYDGAETVYYVLNGKIVRYRRPRKAK